MVSDMEVKTKWHTVAVPETLFSRIKKIIRYTGHMSVSEYIRFACLERLPNDEASADAEDDLREEIKERLQ